MKKKITLALVILLLLVSILGTFCYADEIQPRTTAEDDGIMPISEVQGDGEQNTDSNTTPDYDIIYDDLYVFEDYNYEMNQLIDGNVYIVANGNVRFSGEVNGSVFIFANGDVEFTEDSYVKNSAYIFAKNIKVDGLKGDVYAAAQRFELMENAYISRDVRAMAQDMKLRGTIYRDVYLSAENIDVHDDSSSVLLGGDFNYTSKNKIEGLEDIVLYGEIKFNQETETTSDTVSVVDKIRGYVWEAITSIIYALVIYFILKLIAPKFIENVGKDLKAKGPMALLVGVVTWIVIAIAIVISIILIFTTIGAPVSIISWIAITTIIYISSAVLSIAALRIAKEKIEKIKDNIGLEICALGVIALCSWILQHLPFVGGILSFVIVTTGIGLIIRNIIAKNDSNNNTEQVVVEE